VIQRVSTRTLVLALELLAAVVAFQYRAATHAAKADTVWLAGNCPPVAQMPCEQTH
jgi:hypothetical protein